MGLARLTPDQVSESALRALGLGDVGVDLFSTESMAASLRRAASLLCPATPGGIVRSVLEVLAGLPGYRDDETKGQLETVLEALVGYGDLLELPAEDPDSIGLRIYLGPPSFVRRSSGSCLLIGVRPDGAQLVGDELAALIEYEGHVRTVPSSDALDEAIASSGLTELSPEQWLEAPRPATPSELIGEYDSRLQVAGPSGDIADPRVLDPSLPVTYYRGRWRSPKPSDTGTFVARRPQAFGADLWCFAQVTGGHITQLIDLPIFGSLVLGADEAWRLQAAIDATNERHQQVRIQRGAGRTRLDFFSPLPSWAQRRLDVVGIPLLRERGSLFSYSLPTFEVEEELRFLIDMLWMATNDQPERTAP
jgi:hypothetical protein